MSSSVYRIMVLVSVVVVLCASEMFGAAVITPVAQFREVSVWAEAYSPPLDEYDEQLDSSTAPNYDPFTEDIEVTATVTGPPAAEAVSQASQDSSIESSQIIATGFADCTVWSEEHGGSDSDASGDGYSEFSVTFTVDEDSEWNLTGSMSVTGSSDYAIIAFYEGTTQLFYAELDLTGGPDTVNETFDLTSGNNYELIGEAYAYASAFGGISETNNATFDLTFVPEPAVLVLLTVGGLGLLLRRRRKF